MSNPSQILPDASAARKELIAAVSKIPSIPKLRTPERSVKSAPRAARISVVAIATESADASTQMFSFIVQSFQLGPHVFDNDERLLRLMQRARLLPAT